MSDGTPMVLTDRELNAIKWSVPILRGVEKHWDQLGGTLAGTREGEATSDVLAGIVSRADLHRKDAGDD
jgi:hypothetical protein